MEFRVWDENGDLLDVLDMYHEAMVSLAAFENDVVQEFGADYRGVMSKYGIHIQVIDEDGNDITGSSHPYAD